MTMHVIVFSMNIDGGDVVVQPTRPSDHLSCKDTFAWSRGCPFMTGTTVLLYSLHQTSVFGAIWQELPSLFTSVSAKRISEKCSFHLHFRVLCFDAIPFLVD